jgi:pimeloyl-ACP methyl ester carboxylesterase
MLFTYTSGKPTDPAIIFLHGAGLSRCMWQPQMASLSNDYYCLAPDLPEQGKSVDVRPFELEDAARRVIELIDERVPNKRVHLVGLSLEALIDLNKFLPCESEVPTLVTVSAKENAVAKQHAKKFADCLKHSQRIVVPGVGHVWNLQVPDLFTETVRSWIEDRPLPDALR